MRDSVRFSCDIYQGFPTQGESVFANIGPISDAIQRVSIWEEELQKRVFAGEVEFQHLLSDTMQLGSQIATESGRSDNDASSEDQPMDTSSQNLDLQPMRLPSVSSNDQPMEISSGSSDDEGAPSPSPTISEKKEKNQMAGTMGTSQSGSGAPASRGKAQSRLNYAGRLIPHHSLPARPPTPPGRSWRS